MRGADGLQKGNLGVTQLNEVLRGSMGAGPIVGVDGIARLQPIQPDCWHRITIDRRLHARWQIVRIRDQQTIRVAFT